MRLDPLVAIPTLVEMAVATTDARRTLAGSIKTAADPCGISGTDPRRLCIALPSVDSQREIACVLTAAAVYATKIRQEAALARAESQSPPRHGYRGVRAATYREVMSDE